MRPKVSTALGELTAENCQVLWGRTASAGESLTLKRVINCIDPKTKVTARLVEVEYEGKIFITTEQELAAPPDLLLNLETIPQENFASVMGNHVAEIERRNAQQKAEKVSAIKRRFQAHGIGILKFGVFDISEHTEGTGVEMEIVNLSSKPIKYVTFTYVGLNAVGDPVRDLRGAPTRGFRGIGPIEPGERASYKKEYAWMTDVVEQAKAIRIDVEYMDKSKRSITRPEALLLTEDEATLLGL